jgi:hypothetical protein
VIKKGFITLGEFKENVPFKSRYSSDQIVLIEKSLAKVEWDLKRVSNFIQTINDNYVQNKHDLNDRHTLYFNVKSKHY